MEDKLMELEYFERETIVQSCIHNKGVARIYDALAEIGLSEYTVNREVCLYLELVTMLIQNKTKHGEEEMIAISKRRSKTIQRVSYGATIRINKVDHFFKLSELKQMMNIFLKAVDGVCDSRQQQALIQDKINNLLKPDVDVNDVMARLRANSIIRNT
jgi:hypothetical protein